MRVYGRLGGEAALLTTLSREGRPTVYPWCAGAGRRGAVRRRLGGPATGQGIRRLRLDLVRQQGDGVRVVWSTTDLFPDGLMARAVRVRGAEIRVRYELRYPGWAPGCEGQTEQEDVFRLRSTAGALVRRVARQHNGWHRELHAAVARARSTRWPRATRRRLAALVPDLQVRRRLPATLRPEAACDARRRRRRPAGGVGGGDRRRHALGADLPARRRPLAARGRRARCYE